MKAAILKKSYFSFLFFLIHSLIFASGHTITFTKTVGCDGVCNGSATANVSGGIGPFTYSWNTSPVQTTSTITGLCTGNYTCTVIDQNDGSSASSNVYLDDLFIIVTVMGESCNGNCDGFGGATFFGGNGGYTFNWAPMGGNGINASGLCAGTYTVTVTDANNCSKSTTATVFQPSPIIVNTGTSKNICLSDTVSLIATATGGTQTYTSFLWSPNLFLSCSNCPTPSASPDSTITYTLTVTDNNGCNGKDSILVSVSNDSCGYVWPGDANEDLSVDNKDILSIGIAHNRTGTSRTNSIIDWVAQYADNWTSSFADGTNHKYADCNGDGVVNGLDAVAVGQNYHKVHSYRMAHTNVSTANPELSLQFIADTMGKSDHGTINVNLGSSSLPADNIYGLAFTINFDTTLVDPASLVFANSTSWMGAVGSEVLNFSRYNGGGDIDIAITKINQLNSSGFGQIGAFDFTTADVTLPKMLYFTVSNVTLINKNETPITVDTKGDSIFMDPAFITGINENVSKENVRISPNPFNQEAIVHIAGMKGNDEASFMIYNILGKKVFEQAVRGNEFKISKGELSSGIYIYKLIGLAGNIATGKLVIE